MYSKCFSLFLFFMSFGIVDIIASAEQSRLIQSMPRYGVSCVTPQPATNYRYQSIQAASVPTGPGSFSIASTPFLRQTKCLDECPQKLGDMARACGSCCAAGCKKCPSVCDFESCPTLCYLPRKVSTCCKKCPKKDQDAAACCAAIVCCVGFLVATNQ